MLICHRMICIFVTRAWMVCAKRRRTTAISRRCAIQWCWNCQEDTQLDATRSLTSTSTKKSQNGFLNIVAVRASGPEVLGLWCTMPTRNKMTLAVRHVWMRLRFEKQPTAGLDGVSFRINHRHGLFAIKESSSNPRRDYYRRGAESKAPTTPKPNPKSASCHFYK